MKRVALIGGTGAADLVPANAVEHHVATTPWGEPSRPLLVWRQEQAEVFYLPRHGGLGAVAPHLVNYRANVQALCEFRPDAVIGINAVGGITPRAYPGRVLLPGQLIDYTWGRAQTYFDGSRDALQHIEFDPPFTESLRLGLVEAAATAGIDAVNGGTYGVTQGPRLETAAEIDRMAVAGCDIVGMTAMPEAALAREAGLRYAICAVVVNRAAGRQPSGASIHADLGRFIGEGMARVRQLLDAYFSAP